jgi:hypothetical protein
LFRLCPQTAQPLIDLGRRQEDRLIRPPDLQCGNKKLDLADFGGVQLVYDPQDAMNAHGAGGGDFAQKIVSRQQDAVFLTGCRDQGEAVMG